MTSEVLETPRLRLLTITTERMDADAAHSPHFPVTLGAEVPPQWPPEHWEPHVFAFMKEQIRRRPETTGWNRYVVLREPRPTLIGTLGAFPRDVMEAEIGYELLPQWHHRGLATEAVRAFLAELAREPGLTRITAQTLPELAPSIALLLRCGFAFVGPGDEPGAVRYARKPLPIAEESAWQTTP